MPARRIWPILGVWLGAAACGTSGAGPDGGAQSIPPGDAAGPRPDAGAQPDGEGAAGNDGGRVDGGGSDGGGSDALASAIDARTSDVEAPSDGASTGTPDASGGAPLHVVGGYYPNWTPSPVRIRDIDPHYNVIYLFAATPTGGSPGTGALTWTPPGDGLGAATNLKADIAYARQTQGRKIILSIGGAGEDMSFPDRQTSQTFLASFATIYSTLGGIDGIDWDTYEGSDSPDTSEMIWIGQQLKSTYPGFLVTSPPAPWSTVDQTFCSQMAAAGALDWCAPQYYDGPDLATQAYIVPSVDTWSKLLGEGKVVVGFGVANATNYMTIDQAVSTWKAVAMNHPNLRGAFDWQIDVDESTGWPFALQVGPLVAP